jgi:hypothetical protein
MILKREHFEHKKLYVVSSVTGTMGLRAYLLPSCSPLGRAELAEKATFQEQRAQW